SPSGKKPNSPGSGVSPTRYMTTSLPRLRSPSVAASIDPSASPSGFSWVTTRKRSLLRSASRTAAKSVMVVVIGCHLVDQPAHPDAPLDRGIVFEGQVRRSLQAELAGDPRLDDRMGRLEPGERALPLLLVAEHRAVDRRLPPVR